MEGERITFELNLMLSEIIKQPGSCYTIPKDHKKYNNIVIYNSFDEANYTCSFDECDATIGNMTLHQS